ncbi:MAG: hypothetical protein FIA94_07525 [Nitrospirae bacterium]|nr:hypothetical protein [Nitrospirota bacterium]
MKRTESHIYVPLLISAVFFAIAFTPASMLGCRARGLLALGISLSSGLAGVGTGIIGLKKKVRSEADAMWWMLSTAILTIPVIGMIILA